MKKLIGFNGYFVLLQIAALLTVPFIIMQALNPAMYVEAPVFCASISSLPRVVTVFAAKLYVLTRNEALFSVAVIAVTLLIGFAWKKAPQKYRKVFLLIIAILLTADLVIRLLPLWVNNILPEIYNEIGFAVRCISLASVLLGIFVVKINCSESADRRTIWD